jgi:hypothetical protein
MLNTIYILIQRKYRHKIRVRETVLIPDTSASLYTTSAAEAHLSEGQFLLQELTLDKPVSDILNRNSKTNVFQNRKTEFRTKVNLKKKARIEAVLRLT